MLVPKFSGIYGIPPFMFGECVDVEPDSLFLTHVLCCIVFLTHRLSKCEYIFGGSAAYIAVTYSLCPKLLVVWAFLDA